MKVGRALRAVADDHQAALSVGIPLQSIWIIVWSVAGIVALVAGIMWGTRSGVQFSLSLIALKALPVLILGGFTSVPGAIVGGLIIGVGEKVAEEGEVSIEASALVGDPRVRAIGTPMPAREPGAPAGLEGISFLGPGFAHQDEQGLAALLEGVEGLGPGATALLGQAQGIEQAQPVAIEEHVEGCLPGSLAVPEGKDLAAVWGQRRTRHVGSSGACRAPLPCTPVTVSPAADEPPGARL